jgi:hypothetical protein
MNKETKLFGKKIRFYTTTELQQMLKAQAVGIQDMLKEQDIIAEELTRRYLKEVD